MRSLFLSLAVTSAMAISASAHADTTFNFSLSGAGAAVTGTLTAANTGAGAYTITGINAAGVSGLLAPGNMYFTNDNLLFPTAARTLDINGFAFTQTNSNGTFQVNIFSNLAFNPPTNVQFLADVFDAGGGFSETPVTFSVTAATPEPSSFVLLGTGVIAVCASLRRRLGIA